MVEEIEAGALLLILLAFSAISYKKKSIDFEGILIANIIGIAIYLMSGLKEVFVAVVFFILAEFFTSFARKRFKEKHEKRTIGNIVGNSLAGVLALLLQSGIAFYAAMAAALADTLSSEIGLLSKRKPVLISNLKEVEAGTDGGVTPLGFGAAVLGALAIAAIHFAWFNDLAGFAIIVFAGFLGSVFDSLLGATMEREGKMGNTEVNFLASLASALIAFIAYGAVRGAA